MDGINLQRSVKGETAEMELSFDESGYVSFDQMHQLGGVQNSTLLTEDAEKIIENRPNLMYMHHHNNSIKFCASNKLHKEYSLARQKSSLSSFNSVLEEENHTPPNQTHNASKRRKQHHRASQHIASPKKSKKNLFPSSPVSQNRTRYFNGVESLDIVGMLDNMPMLEPILNQLNTRTLEAMTQVSQRWKQIIYKSKRSVERLHIYHMKRRLTKENVHKLPMKFTKNSTLPLQNSNSTYTGSHSRHKTSISDSSDQMQILNERRVKCPRCGKSSKVIIGEENRTQLFNSQTLSLSHTLPITKASSTALWRPQLNRFYSLDSVQNSINQPNENCGYSDVATTLAECTGTVCKFKFCLHCSCAYHPGNKCPVTELGTPSKILMDNWITTPPKHFPPQEAKLSKKKSLKRLCF